MRRTLFPVDAVIGAYFAILTLIVLARWPHVERPFAFIGFHSLVVGTVFAVAWAHARHGGRVWQFVHYWIPAFIILAAFRELHYLIPQVHNYADRRWDRALHDLDARWFGDVVAWLRGVWSRPLSDVMHLCYWMYFPMPVILCSVLYRRGELDRFRETATVLFVGWYLSYFGYMAVPAVGPHHLFDGPRAPELGGLLWGDFFHALLMELEWEMPDAFPSGHALVSLLTLYCAWRHHRRTFWTLVFFGSGCVLATVYLRYHYVVDVAGSLAFAPIAVVGGRALAARWQSD